MRLVRNYDLSPDLNEGLLLRTEWTGMPVMGMVELLWGLSDGVNAAGLSVALAFGGRSEVTRGFGVTTNPALRARDLRDRRAGAGSAGPGAFAHLGAPAGANLPIRAFARPFIFPEPPWSTDTSRSHATRDEDHRPRFRVRKRRVAVH